MNLLFTCLLIAISLADFLDRELIHCTGTGNVLLVFTVTWPTSQDVAEGPGP